MQLSSVDSFQCSQRGRLELVAEKMGTAAL